MAISNINVAIIDDEKGAIKNLKEEILSFRNPSLNLLFTTTNPVFGIKQAQKCKPDIIFLDIEMPMKNGIEVLRELRDNSDFDCHIVFQTAYANYTINALREAAFDFILKPVDRNDLSNMINRFMQLRYKSSFRDKIERMHDPSYKRVGLPTSEGLFFTHCDEIVACEYISYDKGLKPYWCVNLYDNKKIMLRRDIKGQSLLGIINSTDFFMINSGAIVNLNHVSFINYKNRTCLMQPPFDKKKFIVSRTRISKFKNRYDKRL